MPAYGDVGVEHHTALEATLLEQSARALFQTHESRVSFIYVCIDTYSACLAHSYLLENRLSDVFSSRRFAPRRALRTESL
jgi:hypothetical protein